MTRYPVTIVFKNGKTFKTSVVAVDKATAEAAMRKTFDNIASISVG